MMDLLWSQNKFLGIEWHFWKVIGWLGNVAFSSRFIIQWYASEKRKQVVIPTSFWWLSLFGSLCLLSYAAFYQRDSVFIFAYAFNWIPYIRNLIIQKRSAATLVCPACSAVCSSIANFCFSCGVSLSSTAKPTPQILTRTELENPKRETRNKPT